MSHPKCSDLQYIDFLIASPCSASCCEAARSQPEQLVPPTHDAYTRLLQRGEPDPETLYGEVEPLVKKRDGVLIFDDSTLDHFYSRKIQPVHRHWSGKHKRVVWGINLISLIWSDGDRTLPVDYRVSDKPVDGLTKNDHFLAMLGAAKRRGFSPHAVLFDSWYSSLENLKAVRECGWAFLTQFKVNRKVDLDRQGYRAVSDLSFATPSLVVHLQGFGSVRVFKVVSRDGDIEYWATNDLAMRRVDPAELLAERSLGDRGTIIEALKQCCNVERCAGTVQRGPNATTSGWPSGHSLRLERHFYATGDQLVRGEGPDRPRSDPSLSIQTTDQNAINCVTPMSPSFPGGCRALGPYP